MINEWEQRYLDGDTPWDKGAAAPPLLEYLAGNGVQGSVAVPGCGVGHDVRALAQQGALVTGFDIAPSALSQAESFPRANGERYESVDFLGLPARYEGQFDWIFEHTCFCAIDPSRRLEYVQACVKALKPGGQMLAIFFMTPDAEQGPPFGVTEQELDQLFQPHFKLIRDVLPQKAYPGREGRERLRVLQRIN